MSKLLHLPEGREARVATTPPSVEYRDAEGGKVPAAFVGQAIVCGVRSVGLGGPGFRFVEIIDPKALDEADLSDVIGVFNHDADQLLGRTTNSTLTLTRTQDGGLAYRIPYDAEDPDHVRVMRKIVRGDVVGSSFMFTTKADDWQEEETEGGGSLYVRTVLAINAVYDVCPVTNPAYPDATAAKRSHDAYVQAHPEARMKGMDKKKGKKDKKEGDSASEKAERVFLTDMIPHHEMAIEMAKKALQEVENPDVRDFCQSIIDNQGAEIDKMKQWLADLDSERSGPCLNLLTTELALKARR